MLFRSLEQPLQKVGRRVGALLRIGGQEAQAGEFIYGGVLIQAQLRVSNTPVGHHLHVHLDPLSGIGHLLVGLGFVRLFLPSFLFNCPICMVLLHYR